jgi:hypothetical protein
MQGQGRVGRPNGTEERVRVGSLRGAESFQRRRRQIGGLVAVATIATLFAAVPAQARETHVKTASFGSFPQLTSIAV